MNPFRSEAEAFRFVMLTIGYFAAIVIPSVLWGPWAGTPVFVVLTIVALWWFLRQRAREAPPPTDTVRRGGENERRILVIANETVGGRVLLETIREHAAGVKEDVLVVTPALNSPLRHWASDEDSARVLAGERLGRSLAKLAAAGIEARGEVGDGDPVQAIEDACRTFGPDEIIISTHPEGRSNWLERGVVDRARQRFTMPITHVVTDIVAESEEVL